MRVDLGSLQFNMPTPDDNGTTWLVIKDGIDGWNGPGQRQTSQPATSKHGAQLLESMLDTRPLVLKGIVKATTEETFWFAYNDFLGATNNLFTPIDLVVYEHYPKKIGVIRGGTPRIPLDGIGSFTFELPLLALDPLKRLLEQQNIPVAAGDTVPLVNQGNFETWPVVTVLTPGSIRLTNTVSGQVTRTRTNVAVGDVLDFKNKRLSHGTNNLYGSLDPTSMWWAIQPGTNPIVNAGTAGVRIDFYDTFL